MKISLSKFIMVLVIFYCHGAFAQKEIVFTEKERIWAENNKEVVVGLPSFDYPPYIIYSGDKLMGVYRDYLNIVSNAVNIKFVIRSYASAQALTSALIREEIDVIVGFSQTPERCKVMDFTEPFLLTSRAILVNNDKNINSDMSTEMLKSLKIAVEKGFSSNNELRDYSKDIDIFEVDTTSDAIAAVRFSLVDAYYSDKLTVSYLQNSQKVPNTSIIELKGFGKDKSYFALRKGMPEFKSMINKALSYIDNSTQAHIISRWNSNKQVRRNALTSVMFTEEEAAWIKANPVIYYTSSTSFPPFTFSDPKNGLGVGGLSIDVLALVVKKLGVELKYVPTSSRAEAINMLHRGELTLFPFFIDDGNSPPSMVFTDPYLTSPWVLLTSTANDFTLRDTENPPFIIANPSGYFQNSFIKEKFPNATVINTGNVQESLPLLNNGKVSAVFSLLSVASPLLQGEQLGEFMILNDLTADQNIELKMVLSRDNTILMNLINRVMNELRPEEKDRLHNRWINYSIERGYNLYDFILPIAIITAVFLMAILMVVLWNRALAKQVYQRSLAEKRALKAEQEAIGAAKAKTDFLAKMSHEIRTPMNGVLGMTEALNYTTLSYEQTDLLNTLQGSARNLMSLLNDVLDFSKMDAGKIVFEEIPFAMSDVLSSCIDNYRHKAKSSQIELSWHIDNLENVVCVGDPSRLGQVLNNLLSNSIKFTETGSVELRVFLLSEKNNSLLVQFDIRDTGIGIPKSALDKLFIAFSQAEDDTTRKFGGTGLGLSICKEIVEALNGHISVKSEEGVGSLFSIKLPFTFLPNETPASYLAQISNNQTNNVKDVIDLSTINVLFAEDNPVNRKVIAGQLSRLGISPDIAHDGMQAYEKYKENGYDVIISDCHMPNMDGFELANIISKERKGTTPYLLALTADAMSGSSQKCLTAGFDDYLSKPCPQTALLDKLTAASQSISLSLGIERALANWDYSEGVEYEDIIDETFIAVNDNESLNEDPKNIPVDHFQEHLTLNVSDVIDQSEHSTQVSAEINKHETLLDINKLFELSDNDPTIVHDIISSFVESNEEDQQILSRACSHDNLADCHSIIHRIKGSIRYLAVYTLCDEAELLEGKVQEVEDEEQLIEQIKAFCEQLGCLRQEAKDWLVKHPIKQEEQ